MIFFDQKERPPPINFSDVIWVLKWNLELKLQQFVLSFLQINVNKRCEIYGLDDTFLRVRYQILHPQCFCCSVIAFTIIFQLCACKLTMHPLKNNLVNDGVYLKRRTNSISAASYIIEFTVHPLHVN